MKIKNKIPEVTKSRGLTPTELHRRTKTLSWPTVLELSNESKRYLSGRTTLKTLVELSQALGCQMADLLEVSND